MKNRTILALIIVLSLMFSAAQVLQAGSIPLKGDDFPQITLPEPANAAEQEYLGLTGKGRFGIKNIKADVLILEIFNTFCSYCQEEARNVNELYKLIHKRPDLKDRIKIIGVGAGNTSVEVNAFRAEHNIRFPLFRDGSFTVHRAVGQVSTPYFFVLKINSLGPDKIIYSKVGSIHDPGRFLAMILKEAGIK